MDKTAWALFAGKFDRWERLVLSLMSGCPGQLAVLEITRRLQPCLKKQLVLRAISRLSRDAVLSESDRGFVALQTPARWSPGRVELGFLEMLEQLAAPDAPFRLCSGRPAQAGPSPQATTGDDDGAFEEIARLTARAFGKDVSEEFRAMKPRIFQAFGRHLVCLKAAVLQVESQRTRPRQPIAYVWKIAKLFLETGIPASARYLLADPPKPASARPRSRPSESRPISFWKASPLPDGEAERRAEIDARIMARVKNELLKAPKDRLLVRS